MEGGAGLTAFFSAVFGPPACCDGRKEGGKKKRGQVWRKKRRKKKKGRSVVEIETSADVDQGWGLGLDSYRPNQPSDEDRQSVERLFIVCFGVRKNCTALCYRVLA